MAVSRRFFLKSSGVALASFGLATESPSFLTRAIAQSANPSRGRKKVLIALFQPLCLRHAS